MDATASSVAASTGRGRGAAGALTGVAVGGAAAGVAAITRAVACRATASRRYGLDLVLGLFRTSGALRPAPSLADRCCDT